MFSSIHAEFFAAGILNFADNSISISGKLYADLSHVGQGAVTVLFLADIPDQVRVLTMYGRLKTGFRNSTTGDVVEFTPPVEAPSSPTATIIGPGGGSNVAIGDLNGRGYLDVSFAVPAGGHIDVPSVTDVTPEFTIIHGASSTITTDDTQTPILINESSNTFRY